MIPTFFQTKIKSDSTHVCTHPESRWLRCIRTGWVVVTRAATIATADRGVAAGAGARTASTGGIAAATRPRRPPPPRHPRGLDLGEGIGTIETCETIDTDRVMITEAGKGIRGTPARRRLTFVDAAGTDRGMPGDATETYPGIGTTLIGMTVAGTNTVVGVRATGIGNDRATEGAETAIDTTGTTPTGRRTIRGSHRIITTTARSTRRRRRRKKTKKRKRTTRRTARSTSERAATAMTTGSAR